MKVQNRLPFIVLIVFSFAASLFFMQCSSEHIASKESDSEEVVLGSGGLGGHVGFSTPGRPDEFGAGFGFYSAVWPLVEQPLAGFQIGLPSKWMSPDNTGFEHERCPEGTISNAYFNRDLFQTIEGGLGYWRGNRFHYDSPKFSMNGVPNCYNSEIASPGWPFFYRNEALPDDELGIVQLSNSLMIPPDGITFQGSLEGNFLGYTHMALPLTPAREGPPPTGDQNWTLFFNTENFKGPVAYYLPEMWSRLSKDHEKIYGRGLDAQPGNAGGGAMEINTVPTLTLKDDDNLYIKVPQLQFPLDDENRSVLVQDVTYYSRDTIFDCIENWRDGGEACSGVLEGGKWQPQLNVDEQISVRQLGNRVTGLDKVVTRTILPSNAFAFQWNSSSLSPNGLFPRYFKQVGDEHMPVGASEVPSKLRSAEFPLAETENEYINWRHNREIPEGNFRIDKGEPYYTTFESKAWTDPGPSAGPFHATLEDGSEVTFYWFRFIDQPVFHQVEWNVGEKQALQNLIVQIHKSWPIDQDYMTPPTIGGLISIDSALIVTPPEGMEYGYVPIVTRQEQK